MLKTKVQRVITTYGLTFECIKQSKGQVHIWLTEKLADSNDIEQYLKASIPGIGIVYGVVGSKGYLSIWK